MRPGCTLHPLLTGIYLYKTPSREIPFGVLPIKRIKNVVEDLIGAGAQHIELVGDIVSFTPSFKHKFRKEMKHLEEFKKQGITFSVHINHIGYSFPTHYKYMRHCTIAQFQSFISYYKSLEPIHYTLHLGPDEMWQAQVFKNLPTMKVPSLRRFPPIKKVGIRTLTIEELLRNAPNAFKGLGEIGVDLSKVYIENSEGMTRQEFDSLFGPISRKFSQLGCVLDVGHLLMEEYLKNKHCLENFIEYWGKKKNKIKAIHCQDVFRKGEHFADHQNLGTGKGILNLSLVLRKLENIDFQGPIIFEPGTHRHEEIVESVKFLAKEIEKIKKSK